MNDAIWKDGGAVSVLMLALLALAGLLCLATADAANVVLARSRAQTAADAAALAAAAAQHKLDATPHAAKDAARAVAEANHAELVSCDCPVHGSRATVVVRLVTRIRMLGVAPGSVTASSTAAVELDRVFAPRG